jgi:hypothetical protein
MRLAMHAPTARRTSLRHYPAESRSPTDCRFARGGVDELRRQRLHPAAHRHVIDGVLLAHSTQPSQPGGSAAQSVVPARVGHDRDEVTPAAVFSRQARWRWTGRWKRRSTPSRSSLIGGRPLQVDEPHTPLS